MALELAPDAKFEPLPTTLRSFRLASPVVIDSVYNLPQETGTVRCFANITPLFGKQMRVRIVPTIYQKLSALRGADCYAYAALLHFKKKPDGTQRDPEWWLLDVQ